MTAAGAAVMGHPAASVAWLANQLAAEGEVLKAGQLVFSGGVTAPVPVLAGGSVTFQFGGLGSIEVAGACRLGRAAVPTVSTEFRHPTGGLQVIEAG